MSRRAATPQQESNGTWGFVTDVGEGPDGKRRQARRRGFATKKAAQQELDRLRVNVHDNAYVAPARQSLAEYLGAWLETLPTAGRRPSTIDSYKRNLEGYVIPRIGQTRLGQLTAVDLDRLYSALLADGRRLGSGGGLSPRTVRYIHTTVHKALSDAVRKKLLSNNVAEAASPPDSKSTRPREMSWWKPAELRTFLDFTADERLGPLFRVAAMTGMRRGEVCGLRWTDVDLERSRVEVRQQLIAVGAKHELLFQERTKTDHGRRTIDLDPATVATLRSVKARQAGERLLMGVGYRDAGLVFCQPDGSPADPESVAKVFDRRVARSKLPRIRFHDLRHTHVAHLIATGEQPLLIARRLGHASAAFTQDRYGHLFEDAGSQAATAVAAMVDGI